MNKFETKIKSNRMSFDEEIPPKGHEERFLNKLDKELHHKPNKKSIWLKIAASMVLIIGVSLFFFIQNESQISDKVADKKDNSIPLREAENYYQNSFKSQFAAMAKNYTDNESLSMISESEKLINELEKDYEELEKELKTTADQRVATAMILNYKSRISILEMLIQKLEYVTQLKNEKNEKINA